jgi:hypothetical protein
MGTWMTSTKRLKSDVYSMREIENDKKGVVQEVVELSHHLLPPLGCEHLVLVRRDTCSQVKKVSIQDLVLELGSGDLVKLGKEYQPLVLVLDDLRS